MSFHNIEKDFEYIRQRSRPATAEAKKTDDSRELSASRVVLWESSGGYHLRDRSLPEKMARAEDHFANRVH